ncbi:5608_t:CDS:2, partial [Cetraspora pellucida]
MQRYDSYLKDAFSHIDINDYASTVSAHDYNVTETVQNNTRLSLTAPVHVQKNVNEIDQDYINEVDQNDINEIDQDGVNEIDQSGINENDQDGVSTYSIAANLIEDENQVSLAFPVHDHT